MLGLLVLLLLLVKTELSYLVTGKNYQPTGTEPETGVLHLTGRTPKEDSLI